MKHRSLELSSPQLDSGIFSGSEVENAFVEALYLAFDSAADGEKEPIDLDSRRARRATTLLLEEGGGGLSGRAANSLSASSTSPSFSQNSAALSRRARLKASS
jgi:hypothetical protein